MCLLNWTEAAWWQTLIIRDTENKSDGFSWWALRSWFHLWNSNAYGDRRRKVHLSSAEKKMLSPHRGSLDTGSFILRSSISNFCSRVGGSKIACLQDRKRSSTLLTSLFSICTKIKIQVPLFALLTLLPFYPGYSESRLSMTLLLPGQRQPPLFLTLLFPFLSLCFSLIRLAWLKSSCCLAPLRLCHSPLIALSSQLSVLKARHLPGFISNFSFS